MPQPLQYQAPVVLVSRPAPRWVWAVVIVYLLLLIGALSLPVWAMVLDPSGFESPIIVSICVGVPMACGVILLRTPVRNFRQRPTDRRSYVLPLIASAVLFAILLGAITLALAEVVWGSETGDLILPTAAGGAVLGWLAWAAVFWFGSRSGEPAALAGRFHRWLLSGSVAELLVAVPSHIYVRQRGDCCAGVWTGTAICLGSLVMLVCFGPSVVLLYLKRAREIAPAAGDASFSLPGGKRVRGGTPEK